MNNQQKIEVILTKIREACPELWTISTGYQFIYPESIEELDNTKEGIYTIVKVDQELVWAVTEERGDPHIGTFELSYVGLKCTIIGHEPHLEHLMRVVGTCEYECNTGSVSLYGETHNGEQFSYDLTKSLTQNLETNQDLTDFLYKILFEK